MWRSNLSALNFTCCPWATHSLLWWRPNGQCCSHGAGRPAEEEKALGATGNLEASPPSLGQFTLQQEAVRKPRNLANVVKEHWREGGKREGWGCGETSLFGWTVHIFGWNVHSACQGCCIIHEALMCLFSMPVSKRRCVIRAWQSALLKQHHPSTQPSLQGNLGL